jgi:hypothetical protein
MIKTPINPAIETMVSIILQVLMAITKDKIKKHPRLTLFDMFL